MTPSEPVHPAKQIGMIAGEASGDLHGAALVQALQSSGRPLEFFGLGGQRMAEGGVEMVYPPPLSVVGFTEVLAKIVHIARAYGRVKQALVRRRADLLILIDYPDLNLRLARFARARKIPVLFYISPQVWAWRSGRVKTIARSVDRLAVILPFEEEFYRTRGVRVEFVGHPLLDTLGDRLPVQILRPDANGRDRPWRIGLLPGSRPAEVRKILPILLETARRLQEKSPQPIHFLLPVAPTLEAREVRDQAASGGPGLSLRFLTGPSRDSWKDCDLALVASGTVTLEAALAGVPTIIVYKVSPLNYWIAKRLVKVPYIGLVNWIAGKKICPEFIQDQATPKALTDCALRLLTDGEFRISLQQELAQVRKKLGGPGASRRVAQIAWELMAG